MEKVILGMSGGVDSAVSAYLLQKQGYEVIAVHFYVQESPQAKKEQEDCEILSQKLQIPLLSFSLETDFQEKIIDYYLKAIADGKTPSPCPLCDDIIKFQLLFDVAKQKRANYVASGHYAKIEFVKEWGISLLKQEHCIRKDQSYMLYRISTDKLRHILFPLAEIEKQQVREIAQKIHLTVAEKKDSQGICFAPEGYQSFLRKHLSEKIQEGNFVNMKGKILGKHQGYPLYTLGQRRGLGICSQEVLFITDINSETNEITLGPFDLLLQSEVALEQTVFHLPLSFLKEKTLLARPRFSSTGFLGRLEQRGDKIFFLYQEKNTHNAPGQHLVLFYHNYVVGGGIIV